MMTTQLVTPQENLIRLIASVEGEEIQVRTNQGTYGGDEAVRCVGCAEPQFADYMTYERVGDHQRHTVGADPARAPGYAREINRRQLAERRRYLSDLRSQLRRHGADRLR